jgi:hypothetical protein
MFLKLYKQDENDVIYQTVYTLSAQCVTIIRVLAVCLKLL